MTHNGGRLSDRKSVVAAVTGTLDPAMIQAGPIALSVAKCGDAGLLA
jgi:hypothetical protein